MVRYSEDAKPRAWGPCRAAVHRQQARPDEKNQLNARLAVPAVKQKGSARRGGQGGTTFEMLHL